MYRIFQMVSNALVYAGDIAHVDFPVEPSNPCAIIGMEAYATSRDDTLQNALKSFSVAERQYKQGEDFPVGLLMPTAPVHFAQPLGTPWFPGQAVPLPQGMSAGGIVINKGEPVRLTLEDLTAGDAQLVQIVLHCVEFPADCANAAAVKRQYEQLRAGIGELFFFGHKLDYSAAGQHTLTAQARRPNRTDSIRRLGVRGLALDANAAVQEADFQALKAKLDILGDRAPHNDFVPARAIIGHGAFHMPAGQVDMAAEQKSFVRVSTPTPGGARSAYFVQMFEGREPSAETLRSATAVS